jgi:hypothetical protein
MFKKLLMKLNKNNNQDRLNQFQCLVKEMRKIIIRSNKNN